MSLPDYYSRVNLDLLALIPPDAKTVMEIGCGAGALCEAYRRVNPGVKWLAYELNGDAARAAEKLGIEVFNEDIEEGYIDSLAIRDSDCLIFGDVLEHLRNPWEVLKRLMSTVKPGAQVLASIPNVQHWTIIRDLLDGHWRYTDEGLMDRTHLRFFALKSIRELFDQAGLQVHEIRGRDICNSGSMDWAARSGITMTKEMRAYQYIVRAVKPTKISFHSFKDGFQTIDEPFKPLHLHAITAELCCARPRIHEPFAMLGTIPGVKCTTSDDDYSGMPDILIRQRPRKLSVDITRAIIGEGRIIIVELDDLPEAIGVPVAALQACHAIQCSTEALAEVCRKYNPHVMVFENQIAELSAPLVRPPGGPIRIFYGAQNRQADWKVIMPALHRVLNDELMAVFQVVHDQEFYDALPEWTTKFFTPFCEYSKYRSILRSCDIALLPLEDTPFNRCKSDIKFLECAAEGVVPLMSLAAAKAIDEDCAIGMFYMPDPAFMMFEYNLRQLIDNREGGRQLLAEKYYAYVRDHRLLSQHYRKRYDWYLSLLSSKPELHRDLLARCPELRSQEAGTSQPALSATVP